MADFYSVLGIDKNATDNDIKKAYKKMAAKYHPDRFASKSEAEQKEAETKFKEINEAYQTLSDKDKKAHYDRFGSMEGFGQGGFQSGFGGFDMDDIFSDFFGNSRKRGNNAYREQVEPGQTIQMPIDISIEELFTGIHKDINYNIQVRCDKCHGEGGTGVQTCPHCHGTGMITETRRQGFMTMQSSHPCPHCNGTGKIVKEKCKECNGTGFKNKNISMHIDINPGVRNGQPFKYSGNGYEAKNPKAPNGDLILIVQYKFDNDKYKVIGNDVYELIEIPYYDCIIGCKKDVKLPNGKTKTIEVKEYSKEGDTITLNGEGINYGKYIFVIRVKMPTYIKSEERELIKKLQEFNKK